jgi:hypothetical protein
VANTALNTAVAQASLASFPLLRVEFFMMLPFLLFIGILGLAVVTEHHYLNSLKGV